MKTNCEDHTKYQKIDVSSHGFQNTERGEAFSENKNQQRYRLYRDRDSPK